MAWYAIGWVVVSGYVPEALKTSCGRLDRGIVGMGERVWTLS